jgi:predicted ATPase/DNA-binding CsgD family transcriptional regulator
MGTLPAELTSFIGRRQELRDVRAVLSTGRLVTLTGPGGVGKTRLGLRTAAQVARTFPDGVWLAELAVVQDPADLARTVSAAFRLRDADDDPVGRLTRYLEDRALLLVLDNCEHLREACAELIELLLKAAPGIRVLATSRQRLGVPGERVYSVQPLAEITELFEDRAAAVGCRIDAGDRAQVAEICRRLDGIPLAVELAAAWLRVLSVDDLLARMETLAPGRAQILDWSWELCTPAERLLWSRLSAFVGGFDLAAAESVSCADLEVLSGLVDKSIVQSVGGRLQLLETVRQYGLERLQADGSADAVRVLHRDHYLRLAERYSRDWTRANAQIEAHRFTEPEHANLRAALEFSLSTPGQEATGLRLVVALHYHWLFCGHPAEGRHWLERALEQNPGPSHDRAQALWMCAFARCLTGYASTVRPYGAEAEAWARDNGDDEVLAHALLVLGGYWFLTGDSSRCEPLFQQAIGLLEAVGQPSSVLLQLHSALAQPYVWQGRALEGLELARRGLERCEATGEQFARSSLLFARSLAQWALESYAEAEDGLVEAVGLARTFNDVLGTVIAVEVLCWVKAAQGEHSRAAELLGVADRIWSTGGASPMLGSLHMRQAHDICVAETSEALGAERYRVAFERGAALAADFDRAITAVVGAGPASADPGRTGGPLSAREEQVAELVAQGLTNKEIAARLVISRRTAESHVVHILDKLGFSTRSQIASWVAQR